MAANLITLGRVVLSFVAIAMFQGNFEWCLAAVAMTLFVIYLDSLDGVIARKLSIESDMGALFDITGDRIVEHVFWIFFTTTGLVHISVPIIFISRSFIVDALRTLAFSREGKTPFGENSMMRSRLSHFLTASRTSRGFYGFLKVAAFVGLGLIIAFQKSTANSLFTLSVDNTALLILVTNGLVWASVIMNLVRGLPVIWDGRVYLEEPALELETKK